MWIQEDICVTSPTQLFPERDLLVARVMFLGGGINIVGCTLTGGCLGMWLLTSSKDIYTSKDDLMMYITVRLCYNHHVTSVASCSQNPTGVG